MNTLSLKILQTAALALCVAAASMPAPARAADDLGATPQMGFNNWNPTHCRAEFNEAMSAASPTSSSSWV